MNEKELAEMEAWLGTVERVADHYLEGFQRLVTILERPFGAHHYDKNGFHKNDCGACGLLRVVQEILATSPTSDKPKVSS